MIDASTSAMVPWWRSFLGHVYTRWHQETRTRDMGKLVCGAPCVVAVSGAGPRPDALAAAAGGPAACPGRADSGRNRLAGDGMAPVSRARGERCRSGWA